MARKRSQPHLQRCSRAEELPARPSLPHDCRAGSGGSSSSSSVALFLSSSSFLFVLVLILVESSSKSSSNLLQNRRRNRRRSRRRRNRRLPPWGPRRHMCRDAGFHRHTRGKVGLRRRPPQGSNFPQHGLVLDHGDNKVNTGPHHCFSIGGPESQRGIVDQDHGLSTAGKATAPDISRPPPCGEKSKFADFSALCWS